MKREKLIDMVVKKYSDPPSDTAERDEYFMRCALELARVASEGDEVPVGAVIVREGRIVSADFNGREELRDATYHAETAAIRKACGALGGWRLIGCELYVTLEPCAMCAGAILNARIPRTVIGADDPKYGAFGSTADLSHPPFGHRTELVRGVLAEESARLMRDFFLKKRKTRD